MQKVDEMSQGTVKVGPDTLYGAFTTLETEGLIVKVGEADRRKTYALTFFFFCFLILYSCAIIKLGLRVNALKRKL
jgi:Fe2+ or Zn2+ uptake regulation protein